MRLAYTRRILSECHEAEAALRYGTLLMSLAEAEPDPTATVATAAAPAQPRALPPAPKRAELPSGKSARSKSQSSSSAAPASSRAQAPLTRVPPLTSLPPAAESQSDSQSFSAKSLVRRALWPDAPGDGPVALRGEIVAGPADLVWRALFLVSGLALLRDLGAMLGRLFGLRRSTQLTLYGGELVVESTTTFFGRELRKHSRTYATPAVAAIEREVPYGRLYLLLGLAGLTLVMALLLPAVANTSSESYRHLLLAGCGAILAGIAFDLVRFVRSYLRRGHCAITVGVRGGDTYRIAGVPEPVLAQFLERARVYTPPGKKNGDTSTHRLES